MAIILKELITDVLKVKLDWHISILENWDKIVGYLSNYTHVCNIKDDTIFLGVYESVWMQELYLMSEHLISSINEYLGASRIKYIRFKLMAKKKHTEDKSHGKPILSKVSVPLHLSDAQIFALNAIKDEDLKKSLISFLERSLQN